jgi:hypothetical protein
MHECKLSERYIKKKITAIGFNSEEQFNDVIIYWLLDRDATWGMLQRTMLHVKNECYNKQFYQ